MWVVANIFAASKLPISFALFTAYEGFKPLAEFVLRIIRASGLPRAAAYSYNSYAFTRSR